MRRLRCFVAMAFSDETESLWRTIQSTLSDEGIVARRVDKIEHNNDIDDQIIAEMNSCDLTIADLTFARPSVYFEAGYCQSSMDGRVIFTARSDHLDRRQPDNLRVHFDLQMKNIIPWRGSSDQDFVRRLRSRIRLVAEPLKRDRDAAERREATLREFNELSVEKRVQAVAAEAVAAAQALGYAGTTPPRGYRSEPTYIESYGFLAPVGRAPAWVAHNFAGGTLHAVELWSHPKVTKRSLADRVHGHAGAPIHNFLTRVLPSRTIETLIIFGQSIPQKATIESVLDTYDFDPSRATYVSERSLPIPVTLPRGLRGGLTVDPDNSSYADGRITLYPSGSAASQRRPQSFTFRAGAESAKSLRDVELQLTRVPRRLQVVLTRGRPEVVSETVRRALSLRRE